MSLERHILKGLCEQYMLMRMSAQEEKEFELLLQWYRPLQEAYEEMGKEIDEAKDDPAAKENMPLIWEKISAGMKEGRPEKQIALPQGPSAKKYFIIEKKWKPAFVLMAALIAMLIIFSVITYNKFNEEKKLNEKLVKEKGLK